MTPDEHKLMMYMFTRQRTLITFLVELLKSRDVIQGDDLEAYQSLVEQTEYEQKDFESITAEYRSVAKTLGVSP